MVPSQHKTEALDSLRTIPLFSSVSDEDLESIASLLIERREVASAIDTTFPTGTAGVGQFENFVIFDNFRVLGLVEPPPEVVTPVRPEVRPVIPAPEV